MSSCTDEESLKLMWFSELALLLLELSGCALSAVSEPILLIIVRVRFYGQPCDSVVVEKTDSLEFIWKLGMAFLVR